VGQHHAALELPRAHPDEGDPVPVGLVHVGLDLEHQTGEGCVHRPLAPLGRHPRRRRGRQRAHRVEQPPHAEVGQRRAEHDRRRLPGKERRHVDVGADLGQQLELLQGGVVDLALALAGLLLVGEALLQGLLGAARPPGVGGVLAGGPLDQAAEVAGDAHRPVDRRRPQADALLDLVEKLERLPARPVPLVDEGDHRHVPGPADVEQLERLRLEALGRVEQHDRAVDGLEHPVGVLGEVGVARRVQQVQHVPVVVELEHRGRDRDAAVLLHRHPVRGNAAAAGLAVHRARGVDRRRVQRQRLGQRGLARVGVTDHRERPPPRRLAEDAAVGPCSLVNIRHRHRGNTP
jgi:hypothetical protein